jgi:HEAT repeat protein
VTGESLWRVLPAVRRAERDRFLFFFVLAATLNLAATLGLVGSEALFLARLGPERLPAAFILASLATVFGSMIYALVVGRMRNDRLFIVLLLIGATSLLGLFELVRGRADWALTPLFCVFYLAQALFINLHYWTFATDFFDTLASKRLFPLFAVGASIGGMLGGGLAVAITARGTSEMLIVAWALVLLVAAALIRSARGRLLRWAPVGIHEADESSVEGLRGALRYVARSRMAFWLLLSVVGMVFALTLMQYLYLGIFFEAFESAEAMAAFFGIYLAVTNAIEILVGNALTPWLIRRFGVAQANLAHPILTLATFIGLVADPRLYVAILARANRELLENALAGPIRALSYNALSHRFRGRMRALLEGVVFFGAMSIAGGLLLLVGPDVAPTWLALAGACAALLYAAANLIVRREYLRSLVEEIQQGRLDLSSVEGDLDARELEGLARRWDEQVSADQERVPAPLLDLASPLARRGFTELVAVHARHPDPRVRLACVRALADAGDPAEAPLIVTCLDDPDAAVRRATGEWISRREGIEPKVRAGLQLHLDDPDPEVRALSASLLRSDGEDTLRALLAGTPEEQIAGLARMPLSLSELAEDAKQSATAAIREAAIDCLVRIGTADQLDGAALVEDLAHPDAGVRRAAAACLAERDDRDALETLGRALDDVSRSVRSEAQRALAARGDDGVLAAEPHTHGARVWTVDAALGTIASAGGQLSQELLRKAYRDRVQEAWDTLIAGSRLPSPDTFETRFLRMALENAHTRARFLSFRILELLEEEEVVQSVHRTLDQGPSRSRADALEVLSNLADREVSDRLALLLEEGSVEEKLRALPSMVPEHRNMDQMLIHCSRSKDRWIQRAADYCLGRSPENPEERATMERLLALQSVPLFTHLSLEQLEIINRLLNQVEFLHGEVIVREGEPGDELYVLTEGEVAFFKAWDTPTPHELSRMTPIGYFGEIAVLDDEPRSVTVVAQEDCRLLTLGGARFRQLIMQAPEIAFEVFPVLIARIRRAEARLDELEDD